MSIVELDLRKGREYVDAVELVSWVISDSPLLPRGELARDDLDRAFSEALDVIYGRPDEKAV